MIEIIPSINCSFKDVECVAFRLAAVSGLAKWVHVDVADGRFTHHKSWNDPTAWKTFSASPRLEVHLMVEEPEVVLEYWLEAGAKRIIIHYEALCDPRYRVHDKNPNEVFEYLIARCEDYECTLMLSTNPETPVERAKEYLNLFSAFHVLSVNPGVSGQNFLPLTLKKVEYLRKNFPESTIEIDGGMNKETAKAAIDAGADCIVAGSYIYASGDPEKSLQELKNLGGEEAS